MSAQETFARLRRRLAEFPVIDCHEHAAGPAWARENREPIACLVAGYFTSDLESVAYPGFEGARGDLVAFLEDQDVPTEAKWPLFERLWQRAEHTAYARVTKRIMRDVYGESEMSLAALQRIRERLLDLRDPAVYRGILEQANIRCRLANLEPTPKGFLSGEFQVYELDRLVIDLSPFYGARSWQNVCDVTQAIGASVTSLDGYLAACRETFRRMVSRGAVGMKNCAAYVRSLAYGNPPRSEAERLFNAFMADPRRALGSAEAAALEDFLFHRFLEMARDLDLPVQIHTGHMAGIRNDIAKTNAVYLIPLLELHRDVRFDLFHGNWPYFGECLYLGKNYPNVHLDLCWLPIIDPVYARNLLGQGLGAVPHAKFHAFGGDYGDDILHAVAHLSLALDVVAAALASQVEAGWIDEAQALQISADWLFNNPNEYFRLGYDRFQL